jgi:hypothetical protein
MKATRNAGKAFADGYAKGKAEADLTITKLKQALNKALAELVALKGRK